MKRFLRAKRVAQLSETGLRHSILAASGDPFDARCCRCLRTNSGNRLPPLVCAQPDGRGVRNLRDGPPIDRRTVSRNDGFAPFPDIGMRFVKVRSPPKADSSQTLGHVRFVSIAALRKSDVIEELGQWPSGCSTERTTSSITSARRTTLQPTLLR